MKDEVGLREHFGPIFTYTPGPKNGIKNVKCQGFIFKIEFNGIREHCVVSSH